MANPKGNPDNLKPIRSEEEARKKGSAGGKKSGETRRRKRDAQKAIKWMLDMAAVGALDERLEKLGIEEEDRTNMTALQISMLMKASSGDVNAYRALMDYGGMNPEQKVRQKESEARIRRMDEGQYRGYGDDEDDVEEHVDVIITMPDNGRPGCPRPNAKNPPEHGGAEDED